MKEFQKGKNVKLFVNGQGFEMLLINLLNNLDIYEVSGKTDIDISSVEFNSKYVKRNSIFIAIQGLNVDGHQFITDAMNKGASCIVVENKKVFDELKDNSKITIIYVDNSKKAMALIANAFYGYPTAKMKLIGVTGTNGKTTSTFLLKSILESAGKKVGLIGTIDYWINDICLPASKTTPESVRLFELFAKMREANVEYVVMEVSSIALFLERVYGLKYDVAAFTNLTQDHLDFHGNFENYFKSKKILFDENLKKDGFAIYNNDDSYGKKIVADFEGKKYSYGLNNSDFTAEILNLSFNGISINIKHDNEIVKVDSDLTGKFNVYNILLAYSISRVLKFDNETIISGIRKVKNVEGRFKKIVSEDGIIGIVDYSHTPDSLKNALETINQIKDNGSKTITIFGCGGNRDQSKRPIMGKIASELSDFVIITSDNPRNENPDKIINDILSGIENKSKIIVEPDRKKAIVKGFEIANKGDVVLVAGKGHENYQEVKGIKKHFDDSEIIYELIKK